MGRGRAGCGAWEQLVEGEWVEVERRGEGWVGSSVLAWVRRVGVRGAMAGIRLAVRGQGRVALVRG